MEATATRTRPLLFLFVVLAGALLAAGPAGAGTDDEASIGLYLIPATTPVTCATITPKACGDTGLQLGGTVSLNYYAVLCVFGADPDSGIAGLVCGIDYNGSPRAGVDIDTWTLCSGGLDFPSDNWPGARTGNIITWVAPEDCQKTVPGDLSDGVTAVAGFFYLTAYSADELKITPHPRLDSGPLFQVADCSSREYNLDPNKQAGSVAFSSDGSQKGSLPCIKRPTESKTWGQVKSSFGHR
jgi:hypothetical protein